MRTFAFLVLTCVILPISVTFGQGNPPNVLFIISDDLTATALEGYNDDGPLTPNLNSLASTGIRFDAAYCQYPVCGPARVAFMTGLYPAALNAYSNGQSNFRPQHPNLVTLPQLFRQNGYTTARVSKIYHMGVPGDILNGTPGLDDPLSWDMTFNVTGPEQFAPGELEDLSPGNLGQGADFVKVESTLGDLFHADGLAATQAIQLLDQFSQDSEPFFLAVGMVRPHVPLVAPADYFVPFPFGDHMLPFVPKGDLDDMPAPAITQANHIKYLMNEEQQKKAATAYYASTFYMDAQVGRILDHLQQLGLRDDTIVVFTSDHGYNLGEHTMWQKLSLFEDTVRIPLLISDPAHAQNNGTVSTRMIESLDLYPTLAELAGVSMDNLPHGIHGRSFAELIADPSGPDWGDEWSYTITQGGGESLVTPQWRLNRWQNGQLELYDQLVDPNEYTNLANDPVHATVVDELLDQLVDARSTSLNIPSVPLPHQALHYWDFEGDHPYDDKAGDADGDVRPNTTVTIDAGHDGGSCMRTVDVITGADDIVLLDNNFVWSPGTEPFSISYWFNIEDDFNTVARGIFDFSGSGLTGIQSLYLDSSTELVLRVDGSGGAAIVRHPLPEDGEWHFVAANCDPAGNVEIFVDGTDVDDSVSAGNVSSVSMSPPLILGSFNYEGFTETKGLNGRLDDLAIYAGLLTEDEISRLFNGAMSPLDVGNLLLGDINCDGVVNLLDVDPFIELLSTGSFSPKGDFDGDGQITLLDVSGFVSALSGA